jgi:Flp pilus assembly protein TadD
MMSRQVQNAVDAGEGDLEARRLRQRVAANETDLDARILLARLYRQRGLTDLAVEHYRLAVARFADSSIASLELAKTLREMGSRTEALRALQEAAPRFPRNWEILSLQGILEDELGRFAQGEAAHRAAVAIEPGRATLYNNLGYNLLLQGKAEAAVAELRRAVELGPRSEIARNNLGTALALASQKDEALAQWQRSADPAAAHNNLATVLIEQGRDAEARAELEAALALRRDMPEALANLRLVGERNGQPVAVQAPARRTGMWGRIVPWGRSAR